MTRLALVCIAALGFATGAAAQTAPGESAKKVIGSWEFSNADRDKICTATFKPDHYGPGMRVEFDRNCTTLFPLVKSIVAWTFPDNDLLRLVDGRGKVVVEFSEVETGIYEAPTPGVGVLFLQSAAAAEPPPVPPEQVAGDWSIRRGGASLCEVTLATTPVRDGFMLTVKSGCDPAIARRGFAQWSLDRGELLLIDARGNPWRFEMIDSTTWRRLPEMPDQFTLVRQPSNQP